MPEIPELPAAKRPLPEPKARGLRQQFNTVGWRRDLPDVRDYTVAHEKIVPTLKSLNITAAGSPSDLPQSIDLRPWCSPIEDQESLGSCTAQAGVGLMEFFQIYIYGRHIDASRLFLYKATRNLLNWSGDTGAYLRSTMGAMRLFGAPPEKYWPYDIATFDDEPPAFCYAFAEDYEATDYYRLDPAGEDPTIVLDTIKEHLAAHIPSMFGFPVYDSMYEAANGEIPFPSQNDQSLGGHAVMAVGYDDKKVITHPYTAQQTTGAILVRNSWGESWGEYGYGWIPYEFILRQMAVDWWVLFDAEFVELGEFGL